MFEAKYSAPEVDLFGERATPATDDDWIAPVAAGPVVASLTLPGSKSITNRELVLSALADAPSRLRAPLHSRDSDNMVAALRALGASIEPAPATGDYGDDWIVAPAEELTGSTTIECGLAGTVMRFVPAVAALALGPTVFDADDAARGRPMGGLVAGLTALGVDIDATSTDSLPFTVHGTGRVTGGRLEIDASQSSQFVSGLLLSAPRFDEGIHLHHSGTRLPSVPHIEMTLDALRRRGVDASSDGAASWRVAPGPIGGRDVRIESDLSNAAPFLAAAVATGGRVTLSGWPEETTQVGADLAHLLPLFGAEVVVGDGRITVTGAPEISGVDLDLTTGGELAPALAALAALATGPSTIRGIGHIRHHETDRLAALATEINRLGGDVEELADGLRITPRPLTAGRWSSYHDHRMATAGAIIGLVVEGVRIENIATTAKTLPQFPSLWREMVGAHST
ncbi:3-phosphoshikimate 1-carboxyvinyltransferase [Labedella populi]|uniref:3-phosphoshikimate 1-carboxyvinyltransferase n=1 Tax=Labedella populi TaxID=2498850 RepID=A0A3S4AGS9_9MICO|nr:3-phosphoshikimate 1-carboxyvinyltransferase [Labedella populi]RWZ68574.1 3-phosphoshikimate 1-carboxyvinyltransferase [Labedella populi]